MQLATTALLVGLAVSVVRPSAEVEEAHRRLIQRSSVTEHGRQKVADILSSAMNTSFSPCNDFYDYACANYDSQDPYRLQVNVELGKKPSDKSQPSWKRAIANVYQLCVKPNKLSNELTVLLKMIKDLFGGWPIAGISSTSSAESAAGILFGRFSAITGIATASLVPRYRSGSSAYASGMYNLLSVEPIFPLENLVEINGTKMVPGIVDIPVVTNKLVELMKQVFKPNTTDDDLRASAHRVAEISSLLNNASWEIKGWHNPDQQSNITTVTADYQTTYTIPQLIHRFPSINWPAFLLGFASQQGGYAAVFSQPLVIPFPSYVDVVGEIFQHYSQDDVHNFIVYQFVDQIGKVIEQIHSYPGSFLCNNDIQSYSEAVARIDADIRGFDRESIQEVNDIVSLVALGYKGLLKSQVSNSKNGWIKPGDDIKFLIDKIDELAQNVGLNEKIFEDAYLNERMKQLIEANLDESSDPLVVWLANNKQQTNFILGDVGKKIDRYQLQTPPYPLWLLTERPWNPAANVLNIQYSTLQSPLFDKSFPRFYTFAAIGRIIATGIGQNFVSKYLSNNGLGTQGNLSFQTIASYELMSLCYEAQYDQYCINGNCVDGFEYLDMALADQFGLHAALMAWQTYELVAGEPSNQMPSPFDTFTTDQLFFLAYARAQCTSKMYEKDDKKHYLLRKFRVEGALANTAQFHHNYNCQSDVTCKAIL